MKILFKFILAYLVLVIPSIAFSQNNELLFKSTGSIKYQSNINAFVAEKTPIDLVNNSYYRIIQFASKPTEKDKMVLRSSGAQILEYIPNNAYLISVPTTFPKSALLSTSAEVVRKMDPSIKVEYRLTDWGIPAHAQVGNKAKVAVIAMKGLSAKDFQFDLMALGLTVDYYGADAKFAYLSLSEFEVQNVAQLAWVRYIEIIDEEGKPESTEGRTVQKANVINNELSAAGLSYNADGVGVLVRDDGLVGPHIDFHGRLHNLTTDATGTHGDGVAGVMSAAGNLDPSVEAGGSGAEVFVINYQSTFQDNTLSLHQDSAVMITNSSYSNGCNAGYTSTTQFVDDMIFTNQTLMHTFSAGNSNNSDCGYGAGSQWGNITGGHKMGKNVMTTANLNNDATIVASSSRGPAHDGRIKPDISGHGAGQMSTDPNNMYSPFGGTSAAAPSMGGNLAQLYEVYRSLNGGADPNSALIKAAALNSTTDLGTKGPDFTFGWGLINAGRAYEIIANNQYKFATIGQGQTNSDSIVVPAGIGQLRVMVYWHDPAGAVNTTKALVNDLDLKVNGTLLPYILDPTPNPSTLDDPATTGIDRLNNMEQVSIDNPTPGTYAIDIEGFAVPQGPQEYVIVYTLIKDEIKVTYPLGGESLIPGRDEIIHWDALGNTGSFSVDYSVDNGLTWTNIGTAGGSLRLIDWTVPNIPTGQALIRVERGVQSDTSDEIFNIFPVPSGLTVGGSSANSATITWDSVPGATSYYVYQLGAKYMDTIATSTTNSYQINVTTAQEYWLAVSANAPGIEGERSNAVKIKITPNSACGGCLTFNSVIPSTHGFETGMGDFCNDTGDDTDWVINSGSTASTGTGPNGGDAGSSDYIYLEASSPNYPGKTAILGGPCYDLSSYNFVSLAFAYHMYGAAMGSLELEVSTDGGGTWTSIWSINGNQGNVWQSENIDISSYTGSTFTFRFIGITGTNYTSDIALDNIALAANNCGFFTNFSTFDPTNGNNGTATCTPTGGTPPFTYIWSNGESTATISGLAPGTFTVSVTDATGCTETSSVVLIDDGSGCLCSAIGGSFPYIEDFEIGEGNICQYDNEDFDWIINSGGTPSTGTGPSNAYQGTNYFYVEATVPNNPAKETTFQNGCYSLTGQTQASIDFWYNMNGATMGSLTLEVSTNDGDTWTSVWALNGNQGSLWQNAYVDVSAYAGSPSFMYRFVGITGSSFESDIALDQIVLDANSCMVGGACNDNDSCTINDVFLANCTCAGTFQDSDNDTVCDANDICPGHDDLLDDDNDGIPNGCDSVMTSIIDLEKVMQLDVTPNPFSEYLEIQLDYQGSGPQNGRLEIIDVLGSILVQQPIEWNDHFEIRLPTSSYSNGIYYLRYTNNNNSITRKVLKLE